MTEFKKSPLALAILGVLAAGPMHPYGIASRLKQWGKEDVVNFSQRAGLYRTIERLLAAGLVQSHGSLKDTAYPERVEYSLTDSGRDAAERWLAEMIAEPAKEYPAFPAALSFTPMLTPAQLAEHLRARLERIKPAAAAWDSESMRSVRDELPPVALLDDSYQHALLDAERRWIESTLAALDSGKLDWNYEQLLQYLLAHPGPADAE